MAVFPSTSRNFVHAGYEQRPRKVAARVDSHQPPIEKPAGVTLLLIAILPPDIA